MCSMSLFCVDTRRASYGRNLNPICVSATQTQPHYTYTAERNTALLNAQQKALKQSEEIKKMSVTWLTLDPGDAAPCPACM